MTLTGENKLYMTGMEDGRELTHDSPVELLSTADRYIEWCRNNPLYRHEVIRSGTKAGDIIEVPVARPYTIEGFCVFAGISIKTFNGYESGKELSFAATHIREAIRQNLMEGLITGIYNTAIVSRIASIPTAGQATEDTAYSELIIESDSPRTKENLEIIKKRFARPKDNQG